MKVGEISKKVLERRLNRYGHAMGRDVWERLICGGLKFVTFFNFATFLILCKKLWQKLRHFDIHDNICVKLMAF